MADLYQLGKKRIPHSLFQTYVRYKQDTRAVVAWVVKHGSVGTPGMRRFDVGDLVGMACCIRAKGVKVTDIIGFQLREAVKARAQLSRFFMKTNASDGELVDTANHEYFTSMLLKMCELLSVARDDRPSGAVPAPCVHSLAEEEEEEEQTAHSNRYAVLEGKLSSKKSPSLAVDTDCSEHQPSQAPSPPLSPTTSIQADVIDELGEAIELHKISEDIDDLLQASGRAWVQAASGELPLVVAAAVTSTAFESFRDVKHQLKMRCQADDFEHAFESLVSHSLRLRGTTGECTESALQTLQHYWHKMEQLKARGPAKTSTTTATPEKHEVKPVNTWQHEENVTLLQRDMIHHLISASDSVSSFHATYSPSVQVHAFLVGVDSDGLAASFGLWLLQICHQSYTSASSGGKQMMFQCRVHVLGVAQEALSSVTSVLEHSTLPCRCPNTLAFHLEGVKSNLHDFVRAKHFDKYYTSPWIAGAQTHGILEELFYYGLRLFTYRTYVGSVLHIYNVLRETTGYRSPVLDSVMITFDEILFPGGRPSRNFKASYMRHKGGRLHFPKKGSNHQAGCHSIVIPRHQASATAGFGTRSETKDSRLDYSRTSLFHEVQSCGFCIDNATWSRIVQVDAAAPATSPCSPNGRSRCLPQRHDSVAHAHDRRLQHLQQALMQDFKGDMPVAKVNLFAVYLLCTRILSELDARTHDVGSHSGSYCLCYVLEIMWAADRRKAFETSGHSVDNGKLMQMCRDVFTKALDGVAVSDLLWKRL